MNLVFYGIIIQIISFMFLVLGTQQDIREPFEDWKIRIPGLGILVGILIVAIGTLK